MKRLMILFGLILIFSFSACKKNDKNQPDTAAYTLQTGSIDNISSSGASIKGTLSNTDGAGISHYGHVWSVSPAPEMSLASKTDFGSLNADCEFTSYLTGLEPGRTYYVRAYSSADNKTIYGPETSFQTKSDFFSFVVGNNYLQNNEFQQDKSWVMIYSSSGDLLYIQQLANGGIYEVPWPENTSDNKYLVQIYKQTLLPGSSQTDQYTLSAYPGVYPDTWFIGNDQPEFYNAIGTNKVTFTDVDFLSYYFYDMSNNTGFASIIDNYNLEFIQLTSPDNIYIMFMDKSTAPFYIWMPNIETNKDYVLSKSDFSVMQKSKNINFQKDDAYLVYIESEDDLSTKYAEYFTIFYDHPANQSSVQVYYPDNLFSGYLTYLVTHVSDYMEYMVKKRGDIPSEFKYMHGGANITSMSIENFTEDYYGEFDYIVNRWTKSMPLQNKAMNFTYNVYSGNKEPLHYMAPEIPDVIKAENEALLNFDNIVLQEASVYDYDAENSYYDYIYDTFLSRGSISKNVIEYHWYTYQINFDKSEKLPDDMEMIRSLHHSQNMQ